MIGSILFEETHHKLKLVLSHCDRTEILGLLALLRRAAWGGLRRDATRGAGTLPAGVLVVLLEPGRVALVHGIRFGLETPADRLLGCVGEALDGESLEFARGVDVLVVCDDALRIGCRDERVDRRGRREGVSAGGRRSGRRCLRGGCCCRSLRGIGSVENLLQVVLLCDR